MAQKKTGKPGKKEDASAKAKKQLPKMKQLKNTAAQEKALGGAQHTYTCEQCHSCGQPHSC